MGIQGLRAALIVEPRGWLHALELEEKGKGEIRSFYNSLIYVDKYSGVKLLQQRTVSAAEARSQIKYYRDRYAEMKARRSSFRIVTDQRPA